jgi:hypothetical protein
MIRRTILAAAIVASLAGGTPVFAKGCIRGAIVGGIAGHYVGRGHALAGAAAGCIVAHHHYAEQAKAQKAAGRHW